MQSPSPLFCSYDPTEQEQAEAAGAGGSQDCSSAIPSLLAKAEKSNTEGGGLPLKAPTGGGATGSCA